MERKYRATQEMARTMLTKRKITYIFWKELVHTTVYIQNRCLLRPHENEIPYEFWFGIKATMRHFKVFGSKFYIKRTDENISKFKDRADKGIFLGYSTKRKPYKCYNKSLTK